MASPSKPHVRAPRAASPLRPATSGHSQSLLEPLGIVGYRRFEPAILAALATAEPLLLIGEHGGAKTLLLTRLAEALGVSFRHYNASLLQFDDLAGFPIPTDAGTIRYAAPPGAIWGAEAVFFDEIGRCRPETANKLFPILHERRIQGIALESLQHRWAATNPPMEADDPDRINDSYGGVEQLDPALADRFSYVLALPPFQQLSDQDRKMVVNGAAIGDPALAAAQVRELVSATRDLLAAVGPEVGEAATEYVLALARPLEGAQVRLGGRRSATLRRNLIATWAAHLALGRPTGEPAFLAALDASIPERTRRQVPDTAIHAAHTSAWALVSLAASDPLAVLGRVIDPARRAILAATLPRLPRLHRGNAVSDAIAALNPLDAELLAWVLLPRLARSGSVPTTTIETLAALVEEAVRGGGTVRGFGTQAAWMVEARQEASRSRIGLDDCEVVLHALASTGGADSVLCGQESERSAKRAVRACVERLHRWRSALGEIPATEGLPC